MAACTVTEDHMATLLYPMIAEWDADARAWSLLSPDFPEIASVACQRDEIGEQASDALWTAIDARREDNEPLPPPCAEPWLLTKDWPVPAPHLLFFVPVPVEPPATEAVRINVSLDKHLLGQIDREADRRGMTRSGFLADAAKRSLRS